MSTTNMKRFNRYFKVLEKLCTGLSLKLVHKPYEESGVYDYSHRKIWIDSEQDDTEIISVLLHELGHAICELYYTKGRRETQYEAYSRYYQGKHSKKQFKIVKKCEREAWVVAERLAKMLKIPIGKWFFEQKRICLAGYTFK